ELFMRGEELDPAHRIEDPCHFEAVAFQNGDLGHVEHLALVLQMPAVGVLVAVGDDDMQVGLAVGDEARDGQELQRSFDGEMDVPWREPVVVDVVHVAGFQRPDARDHHAVPDPQLFHRGPDGLQQQFPGGDTQGDDLFGPAPAHDLHPDAPFCQSCILYSIVELDTQLQILLPAAFLVPLVLGVGMARHFPGELPGYHDDPVAVGHDHVAGVDGHAAHADGDVPGVELQASLDHLL